MITKMKCGRVEGLNYAHARTTPGAMGIDVIDEVTERKVSHVYEVDCAKGWVRVFVFDESGAVLRNRTNGEPIMHFRLGRFRLQEHGH